eukprot:scaffold240224_cov22-Tisochrysis_lutea.AAC.1
MALPPAPQEPDLYLSLSSGRGEHTVVDQGIAGAAASIAMLQPLALMHTCFHASVSGLRRCSCSSLIDDHRALGRRLQRAGTKGPPGTNMRNC